MTVYVHSLYYFVGMNGLSLINWLRNNNLKKFSVMNVKFWGMMLLAPLLHETPYLYQVFFALD